MNPTLRFRPATRHDLPQILRIIRGAQARMRAAGSLQWQDGYPAAADIAADLADGRGYVLCESRRPEPIAYGAVVFDGEPAYERIEGAWLTERPYVAIHRLAVADGELGRGIGTEFLHRACALARSKGIGAMRIDTNFDNRAMLHILRREGFVCCGKVRYRSGERLAFEMPFDNGSL